MKREAGVRVEEAVIEIQLLHEEEASGLKVLLSSQVAKSTSLDSPAELGSQT